MRFITRMEKTRTGIISVFAAGIGGLLISCEMTASSLSAAFGFLRPLRLALPETVGPCAAPPNRKRFFVRETDPAAHPGRISLFQRESYFWN